MGELGWVRALMNGTSCRKGDGLITSYDYWAGMYTCSSFALDDFGGGQYSHL